MAVYVCMMCGWLIGCIMKLRYTLKLIWGISFTEQALSTSISIQLQRPVTLNVLLLISSVVCIPLCYEHTSTNSGLYTDLQLFICYQI